MWSHISAVWWIIFLSFYSWINLWFKNSHCWNEVQRLQSDINGIFRCSCYKSCWPPNTNQFKPRTAATEAPRNNIFNRHLCLCVKVHSGSCSFSPSCCVVPWVCETVEPVWTHLPSRVSNAVQLIQIEAKSCECEADHLEGETRHEGVLSALNTQVKLILIITLIWTIWKAVSAKNKNKKNKTCFGNYDIKSQHFSTYKVIIMRLKSRTFEFVKISTFYVIFMTFFHVIISTVIIAIYYVNYKSKFLDIQSHLMRLKSWTYELVTISTFMS